MKLINFTKNLAKATLKGLATVFSCLLSVGVLAGGVYTFLYIFGYIASLFGLLLKSKDGDHYILTGYVGLFVFALLYAVGVGIRALYKKIKEIWQDS